MYISLAAETLQGEMQTTPHTNQQFLNEMSDEDNEDSENYDDPRPMAPSMCTSRKDPGTQETNGFIFRGWGAEL